MSGQTITNYDTLVQAIQDWLARSDITDTSYTPELVQIAQNNIYYGYTDNKGNYWPGLRVRAMETAFPGGNILTTTITGGTGYSSGDTVSFDPAPNAGVTATGTLVVTSGVITGITLTNPGQGYTVAPNVHISSSGGSGGSITTTITSGPTLSPSGNLSVPYNYLDIKYLYITDSGGNTVRLERKAAEWIYKYYPDRTSDSAPTYFARDGGVFVFGPFPDSSYIVSGIYYAKSSVLSSGNETDWMITNYPHLVLYASLAEAAKFVRRDPNEISMWENALQNVMNSIRVGNDREGWSGSPLAITPG